MTKADFLKSIEHVADDAELLFVSTSYDIDNDMTWSSDTQVEIDSIDVESDDQVYVVLDTEYFS